MVKKSIIILIIIFIFGFGSLGSQSLASDTEPEIHPFIYGIYGTPPGFDPLGVYDGTSGDVLLNHVEGLYGFNYSDPTLGVLPKIALDMGTWNAGGTEWTIEIRDDVLFHDGTALTAADVKWNWDRLNRLSTAYLNEHSSLWYNNDGDLILNNTEVIDDHTIKFTLNKEWKDFEFLQSFWGCALIKPDEDYSNATITNDEYSKIIGTGPFILDDYTSGENTIFVANNDYYRSTPDIQKLIFKSYGSTTAAMNALMDQECHVVRHVYADNWENFDADPNLNYQLQKMDVCFFFHLNVNNIDWAVRKAMQFAFNYNYLIDVTMGGTVAEIHTPVPDGMIGHNPDLPGLPYYNLTKARQYLIDDPYYGPLISARIADTSSDDDWKACATNNPLATHNLVSSGTGFEKQLFDNMEYIGIKLEYGPCSCILHSGYSADLELVMGGWGPDYWHPINQIEPIYGTDGSSNWNGLANENIDTMMDEAHILTGVDLEAKIDEIVTAIIVEQAASMYIYQRVHAIAWSSKYVSNINDLFNASGDKYFYNVHFTLSSAPTKSGFFDNLIFFVIGILTSLLVVIIINSYRKRKTGKIKHPSIIKKHQTSLEKRIHQKKVQWKQQKKRRQKIMGKIGLISRWRLLITLHHIANSMYSDKSELDHQKYRKGLEFLTDLESKIKYYSLENHSYLIHECCKLCQVNIELSSLLQDMKSFLVVQCHDELDSLCIILSKQLNNVDSQSYIRPSLRRKCELMIQYMNDMKQKALPKSSMMI